MFFSQKRSLIGLSGIVFPFLLTAPTLQAEPEVKTRVLTFANVLELSLRSSPDVGVAEAQLLRSKAALKGARVFPENPTLGLGAGVRVQGEQGGVDSNISLSQTLPLFGRYGAGKDAAAAGVLAGKALLWSAQTQAIRAAAMGFIRAQRTRSLLEVNAKRIALVQNIVETTERKLAAGDGTLLDVNLWQSELGQAEAQRARLEARYYSERAQLAFLCGLDPRNAPPLAGNLTDTTQYLEKVSPAEGQRADLLARVQLTKAADAEVRLQRRRAWPDVTVSLYAGSEGTNFQNGLNPARASGEWLGGIGLSVPLTLFERNQGRLAGAEAAKSLARRRQSRAQRSADVEVAVARAKLAGMTRAEHALRTRVLDRQSDNLTLLRKAHRAGKLSVSDVLLRERTLLNAEAAHVEALANVAAARLELGFATGELSTHTEALIQSSTLFEAGESR